MSGMDIIFVPTPEANLHARDEAAALRVYESSVGGFVSVVLIDAKGGTYKGGTRLTRAQAEGLRDFLGDLLGPSEVTP